MSKGKYKRKREHSREKAEQEGNEVRFPHSEVIPAEQQPETAHKGNTKRGDKKENPMGFSEAVQRSSFTDWCIAAFTAVLAAVGIYQYFSMGDQLDAMKESNQINREALEAVQRASISFSTAFTPVPIVLNDPKSQKINAWQVAVPISNDGSTQTREGLVFFNRHATTDSLADDFEFPDYGASPGARLVTGPLTLGSHQVTHTRLMNVPIEHVKDVQDHKGHFYLYGWAHYRDIFPRTPTHLTEFCFELATVAGDLLKVGGLQEVEWVRCTSSKGKPLHNCFDTECSDYSDAIKK